MYTETSWPRKQGDRARLVTPVIKSESKGCRLRFYYHMKGANIGYLAVYVRKSYTAANAIQVVLNITGEQVCRVALLRRICVKLIVGLDHGIKVYTFGPPSGSLRIFMQSGQFTS